MRRFKKKKRSRPFGHSGGPRKTSQLNTAEVRQVREKSNVPPTNPGVQDVPRSLKEFIKLKELANESTKKTKKGKQLKEEIRSTTDSDNAGDSNARKQPIDGCSRTTTSASASSEDAQIDTEKDDRAKSRLGNIKKKRKLKLEKLKMKRKLKKEQKRKEIEEDEAQPDLVKEVIKFGEVAHRPPQISTLPRVVSKPGFEYRPGRADDLLVKSILKKNANMPYKTQLCAKRKHLSVSDQRQLEAEKNRAILVYRNSKMKRAKTKS